MTPDEVLKQHTEKLAKWKIKLDEREMCLPFMYWSPKMHKTPSKQRFIAASACCSTKQLSTTITKCLKLIDQYHEHTARKAYHASGINAYWIINNSSKVHKMIGTSNTSKDVNNLNSYDFSTLYTAIPHTKLKTAMKSIISRAFEGSGKRCISVYSTRAQWTESPKPTTKAYTQSELIEMVNFLIDNVYVTCGDSISRQRIGIPMGTDCAPYLANLFLFYYEHKWMMKTKETNPQLARRFNKSVRYIDDLLTINNDGLMNKYMSDIYPKELELKHENSQNDQHTTYLDLEINVVNNEIVTSLYDKRDDFPFTVVNFPDLSGNIPQDASYGVFIAQTLRYARACAMYNDFLSRTHRLRAQLVNQNFKHKHLIQKLKRWMNTSDKAKVLLRYGHSFQQILSDLNKVNEDR